MGPVHVHPGELEGDLEFLMRAALKVENIREDLGKVGPVIAAQVEEAMLGKRTLLDTERAERSAEPVRQMLRFERQLREQLQRFHEQLKESERDLRLSPENIEQVVRVGLELAEQPPLREATLAGVWPDPTGRRKECPFFWMPKLAGNWRPCLEGLLHPHTGATRPVVFDHELARGRDDVVLVHLNHRLVQMCLRLLRAEIWASESRKRLHRVVARLVPARSLDHPAVIAHARLVVLGGDSERLHEAVITAGGWIREGRFLRMNVGEVREALAAALPDEAPEAIRRRFTALWPELRTPLFRSLEVRIEELSAGLRRQLAEREQKDVENMSTILRELQRSIRGELDRPVDPQMPLWTEPEQEQLMRDRDALEARLERIPAEIERETAAIHTRYSNPTPRLFPAAVTFLVPENLAR
jgi:hypothetical protein